MTKKTLLICSALLAAPLSGLFAEKAAETATKKQPISETETYREAMAELSASFDLNKITRTIVESNKRKLISSSDLGQASIFKPKQNNLFARLKDKVEPGVSENKAQEPTPAAVVATSPEGKVSQRGAIKITNS